MASPHPQTHAPNPTTSPKPTLLPSPLPASASPSHLPTTSEPPPPPTPPPFTPFFTLITDPTDTTHHHPTVHYLFSDDADTDPITTAALQTLSPAANVSDLARQAQPTERFLLLDIDATGTKVVRAQSMDPGWAVTNAEVRAAPTWEGEGEGGRGMMVRIEGVERGEGGGAGEGEGLERLVERFEKGLGELRRVVEGGVFREEGRGFGARGG